MRRALVADAAQKAHAARNPPHVGDLGVVWVQRYACDRLDCTFAWLGIFRRQDDPDPEDLQCPRCKRPAPREEIVAGKEGRRSVNRLLVGKREQAVAEVNAKQGVLRWQRVGDDGVAFGPHEYAPWSISVDGTLGKLA